MSEQEQQILEEITKLTKYIKNELRRLVNWEFTTKQRQEQTADLENKISEIIILLKGLKNE